MSALVLVVASASSARAQDEETAAGARGGYAWGEEGGGAEPEDPLRVMAFLGFGLGFRPLRNLDPPFKQDFASPWFMDLAAAVIAPGGDVRFGGGLGITTNLTEDVGVQGFQQWVLTPSFHMLIPLRRLMPDIQHDWAQIHGRFGLPFVISSVSSVTELSFGLELALALSVKFLAGLGAYFEVTAAGYGGTASTVHPVISGELGLFFDYEVLP